MEKFSAWLQGEHDAIMAREAEALSLLKAGDKAGYESQMRAKATALAELAEKAQKHAASLPPAVAEDVETTLAGYSGNARMALRLNSVFFMSALLYRDDHKAGEPDNFQVFIDTLAREGV